MQTKAEVTIFLFSYHKTIHPISWSVHTGNDTIFFPKTISELNKRAKETVTSQSLTIFKSNLLYVIFY